MKIEKRQTETYLLSDLDALDPVTVSVTNYELGRGKITIECYGKSWSTYWGGMGERTIQQFFLRCDNPYILDRFLAKTSETDYEEISRRSNGEICATSDVEIAMMASDMREHFGDDWYMDLPQRPTGEYSYVSRIVDAVKQAFKEEVQTLSS